MEKFKLHCLISIFLVSTGNHIVANAGNNQELLKPHLIILGASGVGKSSISNVLLGEKPDCNNCTFPVCHGLDSCTKETSYAVGRWVGTGENFTIVDTPGNYQITLLLSFVNIGKYYINTCMTILINY